MSARSVSREQIATALLTQLATVQGFTTVGRKHVIPSPDQQPAMFVVGTRNNTKQALRGQPGQLRITFHLFIYAYDGGGDEPLGQETSLVETTLNTLIDAIEDALKPDPTLNAQTLGLLVQHCWIEGDGDIDPGVFGKQGFAIVPVHVLVP